MATLAEHRSESRLEIDGAQIKYGMLADHEIGCKFFGPFPLNNISQHGASCEINHQFNKGDQILVDIIIPEKESIHAQGIVKWIAPGSDKQSSQVGIHFNQFGWGEPWNFIPYQSRLHQLVEQHNPTLKNTILNW